MAKAKAHPSPVEHLFRDPDYRALPVAGVGMVMRLIEHHHMTGCRPLPSSRDELHAIARAHRRTWKLHCDSVLAIVARYAPHALAYRVQRETAHESLRAAATAAHARRKAKRIMEAATLAPPAWQTPRLEPAPPRPAPPDRRDRVRIMEPVR